jgi:CheY-like chemotaxis protein
MMTAPLIAIVDDEPSMIELLRDFLEEEGYRTISAQNSTAAFAMITAQRPAVAIIDVQMETETAGLDVVALIRSDSATKYIPVILCTARQDLVALYADWLVRHGCVVLRKPFALGALLRLVSTLVPLAL